MGLCVCLILGTALFLIIQLVEIVIEAVVFKAAAISTMSTLKNNDDYQKTLLSSKDLMELII